MSILGGTDMSLDDLASFSKLGSLLTIIINKLDEQDAAIKQLRERDAPPGKELDNADLPLRQRVSSLEENMALQMERNIASLERKIETQAALLKEKLDATVELSAVTAEKVVTHALQRVEARLEGSAYNGKDLLPEEGEGGREDEHMACSDPKATMTAMRPTLPIALLFPGEGSQYVKMMTSVQDLPAVTAMLQKAKLMLGWDVLELCLNGPEWKLEKTQFCQPAMFVACMAGLEKLRNDRKEAAEQFQATAGLSLGEYSALCAAGVFSFEDGLKLVDIRGKAMQEAATKGKGLMISVAGLHEPVLKELCKKARLAEGHTGVCRIANHLFPAGFTCAGTERAMHILKDMCEKAGAFYVRILKASSAYHTPLMAPAQKVLAMALDEMLPRMNPPRHTVYMNVTAKPIEPGTKPKEVVELLKRQITSPVMWERCVRAMIESGATEFYEVGPMKQIKAMMKRINVNSWRCTANVGV